ncbi:BrnA antitoxin family protein [Paracoccus sp. (in: a-proteobacteria)]
MSANRKPIPPGFDEDEIPDLSAPEWIERFDAAPVRRGRPPADAPKISTTLRLDPDVLDWFKAGGAGWQSRMNQALRKAAGLD